MEVFETDEGYVAVISLRLQRPLSKIPGDLFNDVRVALFNSSSIVSSRHAAIAAYRALRAFREGKNITKSLRAEIAVCLSGERQIKRALEFVDPIGSNRLVLIAVSRRSIDWKGLSSKICKKLGAEEIGEFGRPEFLLKEMGLEEVTSCSGKAELIILEKAALVELER